MPYDLPTEEEAFDRLVKRLLSEEWERFPAPSARVWRTLTVRLGCQANVITGGHNAVAPLAEKAKGNASGDTQNDAGATPLRLES